jgi:uncharacterized lipoprotein YmbA
MTFRPSSALAVTAAIVVLGLTGCASTPNSRFYTLNAVAPAATTTSTLSISVGPVSVPALLDRPQIVVTTGPNQVQIDEFNRWASPVQSNIADVVASDLVAILGAPSVTVFPQAASTNAAYRVTIDVQRMESMPGKSINLDAVWTVRRNATDTQPIVRRTTLTETVQGSGFDAVVAAQSRALAQMARQIADAIVTDTSKP